MTTRRLVLAGLILLAAAGLLSARGFAPRLVITALTPRGAFDERALPASPSYANDAAWLALPALRDEADVAPSESGKRAIEVACADVVAAYEDFSRRTGDARPFLLAGHRQGAAPAETGYVITFNVRGPQHERDAFDFATEAPEEARLCVNPTLGAASEEEVRPARHRGAVFFDSARPALLPGFAASRRAHGRLVVSELQTLPKRDAMSRMLLWMLGGENYHPIEYQLFYADLRQDAARRAATFLKQRGAERADSAGESD